MVTYIIKEVYKDTSKGKKSAGWGIYDGTRLVNGKEGLDRMDRVKMLHILYCMKWCDVLPEQLHEFKKIGL